MLYIYIYVCIFIYIYTFTVHVFLLPCPSVQTCDGLPLGASKLSQNPMLSPVDPLWGKPKKRDCLNL